MDTEVKCRNRTQDSSTGSKFDKFHRHEHNITKKILRIDDWEMLQRQNLLSLIENKKIALLKRIVSTL